MSPAMPTGWMDNAIGGLAFAAISGALGFGWRFRAKWYGLLAGAVGTLGLWCLATYYFRGSVWLPSFGFVFAPAPAWMPFLVGLFLGVFVDVGLGLAALLLRASTDARRPETLPAPAHSLEAEALWSGLEEPEQALLKELWASPGSFRASLELNSLKERVGVERWNATTHTLSEEKQLIRHELGPLITLPGPRRVAGWVLTPKGKNVMTWLTKQASGRPAPTEDRPASRGRILDGAVKLAWTPREYESLWSELNDSEKYTFDRMWSLPETYLSAPEFPSETGQREWNTIEHRLTKAGLIRRIGNGWELTPEGKEIAAWATKTGRLPLRLKPKSAT